MTARDGRVELSFGVMGGHYQAMGHAHLLSSLLRSLHGSAVRHRSAAALPLAEYSHGRMRDVAAHPALGPELTRRGFVVVAPVRPIGGAQAIAIDWCNNTLIGASDPRKDGCALGILRRAAPARGRRQLRFAGYAAERAASPDWFGLRMSTFRL